MSKRSLLFLAALAVAAPLGAQDRAALQREVAALRDSVSRDVATLDSLRAARRVALDDSTTMDGITVRFSRATINDAELDRIRSGIAQGRSQLREMFGADGPSLLDGVSIQVEHLPPERGFRRTLLRFGPDRSSRTQLTTPAALERNVSRALVLEAASVLVRAHPSLRRFSGGGLYLEADWSPDADRVALYALARSASTPARRCATGVVTACRAVLDLSDPSGWYADTDTPRRADPVNEAVRGSLIRYVARRDGPALLSAARSAESSDTDAVALLAKTLDVSPDLLLRDWQASLRESSAQRARPSLGLTSASLIWCGLLLLVATRRRPE